MTLPGCINIFMYIYTYMAYINWKVKGEKWKARNDIIKFLSNKISKNIMITKV